MGCVGVRCVTGCAAADGGDVSTGKVSGWLFIFNVREVWFAQRLGCALLGGHDALTCLVTATRLGVLWVVRSCLGGGIKGHI